MVGDFFFALPCFFPGSFYRFFFSISNTAKYWSDCESRVLFLLLWTLSPVAASPKEWKSRSDKDMICVSWVSSAFCLLLWKTPFAPPYIRLASDARNGSEWSEWSDEVMIEAEDKLLVSWVSALLLFVEDAFRPPFALPQTHETKGRWMVRRSGKKVESTVRNSFLCIVCLEDLFLLVAFKEEREDSFLMDGSDRLGKIWFVSRELVVLFVCCCGRHLSPLPTFVSPQTHETEVNEVNEVMKWWLKLKTNCLYRELVLCFC